MSFTTVLLRMLTHGQSQAAGYIHVFQNRKRKSIPKSKAFDFDFILSD